MTESNKDHRSLVLWAGVVALSALVSAVVQILPWPLLIVGGLVATGFLVSKMSQNRQFV